MFEESFKGGYAVILPQDRRVSIFHRQNSFSHHLPLPPDIVLDNLVNTGQLEEECRDKVRSALLQRHHHLNSKKEGEKPKFIEHIRLGLGQGLKARGREY